MLNEVVAGVVVVETADELYTVEPYPAAVVEDEDCPAEVDETPCP